MYYSNDGLKQASTADKAAKVTKVTIENFVNLYKSRVHNLMSFFCQDYFTIEML